MKSYWKKVENNHSINFFLTEDIKANFPLSHTLNIKTHDVCYALLDKEDLSIAYTDLYKYPHAVPNTPWLIAALIILSSGLKTEKNPLLLQYGTLSTIC